MLRFVVVACGRLQTYAIQNFRTLKDEDPNELRDCVSQNVRGYKGSLVLFFGRFLFSILFGMYLPFATG